jgi:hypothetical protein
MNPRQGRGDGIADIIVAGESAGELGWGIGISFGNGDGTFQKVVFYPAGRDAAISFLATGDFNGDGIMDVVVAGAQGVWLFTSSGNGAFNPGVLAAAISSESGMIAAADFNGDGALDLVVTLPSGGTDGTGDGFAVLFGNGGGDFEPTPRLCRCLRLGIPR